MLVDGARERLERRGIEIGDGACERGVVLGAVREEKRVHSIHVGEERRGLARCRGSVEGFAVGVCVVPGGAQLGVRVENGAEMGRLGGGVVGAGCGGGVVGACVVGACVGGICAGVAGRSAGVGVVAEFEAVVEGRVERGVGRAV